MGTTTPGNLLTVAGGTNNDTVQISSTNNGSTIPIKHLLDLVDGSMINDGIVTLNLAHDLTNTYGSGYIGFDYHGGFQSNQNLITLGFKGADNLFNFRASGNVGFGTLNPNATLDVRSNIGTTPVASLSGKTSFASLVVDNSGAGDLFTASSSGLNRFVITQAGNVGYWHNVPAKKANRLGRFAGSIGHGEKMLLHGFLYHIIYFLM